jgi:hypothetical protein
MSLKIIINIPITIAVNLGVFFIGLIFAALRDGMDIYGAGEYIFGGTYLLVAGLL